MSDSVNRRSFIKKTIAASTSVGAALSLEEKALLAAPAEPAPKRLPVDTQSDFPMATVGKVKISRVICGGNLISGFAHSRDLIYVSKLLKHYFTDERIMDTMELCEENGINTIIAGTGKARLFNQYWQERGGEMQWIGQCGAKEDDLYADIKKAIDLGATGVLLLGNHADEFARSGRVELIGKVVDFIQQNGLIAGIAGHNIRTPMACEEAGLNPDFYMKTLHSTRYWSSRKPDQHKDVIDNYNIDNYWDKYPEKTVDFMKQVKKPWVAYKVLAAGALRPEEGFKFAYQNGADLLCVGMFDFQVVEDALIAKKILASDIQRDRPWRA